MTELPFVPHAALVVDRGRASGTARSRGGSPRARCAAPAPPSGTRRTVPRPARTDGARPSSPSERTPVDPRVVVWSSRASPPAAVSGQSVVSYSTVPGSPKWLAARMPSTPMEMCAHPPGDRGERRRLRVRGTRSRRPRRRLRRPSATPLRRAVAGSSSRRPAPTGTRRRVRSVEAWSQVMVPVPIELLDELVVPIDLDRCCFHAADGTQQ